MSRGSTIFFASALFAGISKNNVLPLLQFRLDILLNVGGSDVVDRLKLTEDTVFAEHFSIGYHTQQTFLLEFVSRML